MKTFFDKLEYPFLVKLTMIENAIFPNKPALSKSIAKTIRIGSKKWT